MAGNICDVCGAKGKTTVRASSMGPVSFAYCDKCLITLREPYGAVLAALYGLRSMDEVAIWMRPIIRVCLRAEHKTEEDLFRDVAEIEAEYDAYIAGLEDTHDPEQGEN